MSTFARTFSIELISEQVLQENPWFTDMLLVTPPFGPKPRFCKVVDDVVANRLAWIFSLLIKLAPTPAPM